MLTIGHPDCDIILTNILRLINSFELNPLNRMLLEETENLVKKFDNYGKEGITKYLENKRDDVRNGAGLGYQRMDFIFIDLL